MFDQQPSNFGINHRLRNIGNECFTLQVLSIINNNIERPWCDCTYQQHTFYLYPRGMLHSRSFEAKEVHEYIKCITICIYMSIFIKCTRELSVCNLHSFKNKYKMLALKLLHYYSDRFIEFHWYVKSSWEQRFVQKGDMLDVCGLHKVARPLLTLCAFE